MSMPVAIGASGLRLGLLAALLLAVAVFGYLSLQSSDTVADSRLTLPPGPALRDAPDAARTDPVAVLAPLNAQAVPHRAARAASAADLDRLQDADLVAQQAEWSARASAGDADAAWLLAALHQYCLAARWLLSGSVPPDEIWGLYAEYGASEQQLAGIRNELAGASTRCGEIVRRSPEALGQAIAAWRARAAQLGHPGARLHEALDAARRERSAQARAAREQVARTAAAELLRESGPAALAEHANSLARIGPYSATAWSLAACQLVPACVADPMAHEMAQLSLRSVQGSAGSWVGWLHDSPRGLMLAQAQAVEIVSLWRAARFDELVPGAPPPVRP